MDRAANDAVHAAHVLGDTERDHVEMWLRALPLVVWQMKPNGEFEYANSYFTAVTGIPADRVHTCRWADIVEPRYADALDFRWDPEVGGAEPFEFECGVRTSEGDYRLFSHRAAPELDNEGKVRLWWGASLDIHDARAFAAKSLQLATDHERVLESVHDGIAEISRDWTVTFATRRMGELLSVDSRALMGSPLFDVVPELEGSSLERELRRALDRGETIERDVFSEHLGRWFTVLARPTQVGLTVTCRDITETRTLRVNLEQAQRLESIGQLTGGIAHDFNNLLTVVRGGAEALLDAPGLSDDDREIAALVVDSADHGAELTASLLAFARRMPLEPRSTDLNELVAQLEPILRHTLGESINVSYQLGQDLPAVRVDPTQLESSVLNLIINARDAMPDGGVLAIDTQLSELDEKDAALDPEVNPGEYVTISVRDTGIGIEQKHLKFIFDPFYSTKPVGEGTGLGLAMVSGFVRQSGGHVAAFSEPGVGTTVTLYLPISRERTPSIPQEPPTAPATIEATVLVVEDDRRVRAFATRVLQQAGYEVVEADDGKTALRQLADRDDIDLIFSDVVMPGGMSGRDLADHVRAQYPDIPIILTSGYTDGIQVSDESMEISTTLVPKPYRGADVTTAIAHALGGDTS